MNKWYTSIFLLSLHVLYSNIRQSSLASIFAKDDYKNESRTIDFCGSVWTIIKLSKARYPEFKKRQTERCLVWVHLKVISSGTTAKIGTGNTLSTFSWIMDCFFFSYWEHYKPLTIHLLDSSQNLYTLEQWRNTG